jgi:hypothetical protein
MLMMDDTSKKGGHAFPKEKLKKLKKVTAICAKIRGFFSSFLSSIEEKIEMHQLHACDANSLINCENNWEGPAYVDL